MRLQSGNVLLRPASRLHRKPDFPDETKLKFDIQNPNVGREVGAEERNEEPKMKKLRQILSRPPA